MRARLKSVFACAMCLLSCTAVVALSQGRSFLLHGIANVPLGNAVLTLDDGLDAQPQTADDLLVISNIGSTGLDGTRFALGKFISVGAAWNDLDPNGALPDGASFSMNAFGAESEQLADMSVTKNGTVLELRQDLPTGTKRVQVFNGATLVADVTNSSSLIATVPESNWPIAGIHETVCKAALCCSCQTDWGHAIPISLNGGPVVMGDRLVVALAVPPPSPLDIEAMTILLKDIPTVAVTNETAIVSRSIPTLSISGMMVLVALLILTAIVLVGRRHRRDAA